MALFLATKSHVTILFTYSCVCNILLLDQQKTSLRYRLYLHTYEYVVVMFKKFGKILLGGVDSSYLQDVRKNAC